MPTGQRPPRDPLTSPLTFRDDLLKDQVVLVSGAGSGIGKAIAIQCARLGARLAICGRKVERLEETAAILRGLGAEVMVRPATIRDAEDVDRLHAEVWERFGRLDHLVNNAGGQFPQAAIDYSVKGWNAVIDTNLNGTWYMMQAAARNWRSRPARLHRQHRHGRLAGHAGRRPHLRGAGGVIYLSKTVAIEWAPLDIRINCVAPGAIATEGMDVYSEEARSELPRSNLMKRFGEATDVADAVTYLIAPSGSFITGEVVVVDGGNQVWGDQWTIPRPDYFAGTG